MRIGTFSCIILLAAVTLCGCATTQAIPSRPAAVSHIVFIKLNDSSETDALLADCDAKLSAIPGVVSYAGGAHLDTGRATVESNYDAGIYIGFDNEADYAAYVAHPNHVSLVNDWKAKMRWLRVYDIYDPTP